MKVLLHTCCAPCSIKCIEKLKDDNINPTVFWYNPNIHPFKEYQIRRDTLIKYVKNNNIDYLEHHEYGLRHFISDIYPYMGKERCEFCYEMRLSKTAEYAKKIGFDAFSTTLLISPYQRHEMIKKIGEKFEKKYNIKFLYRDFRPYFSDGQDEARKMNFYMQKYCGCIFSEEDRYIGEIVNYSEKSSPIKLLKPSTMFKNQIMKYREIFLETGEIFHGCSGLEECETYEKWVNFEERLRAKYVDNYVPSTLYLAIRKSDNKLIGMVDLRLKLTEFLEKFAGNIGYSVLPEERGKGYGKEILKLILLKCKKYGMEKVLVMCDKSNIASSKVITSNGGILKNEVEVEDEMNWSKSGIILRYSIDIK